MVGFRQGMLARPQKIRTRVVAREEVEGQDLAFLPQPEYPRSVGDRDAADLDAHSAQALLEDERTRLDPRLLAHGRLSSRWQGSPAPGLRRRAREMLFG